MITAAASSTIGPPADSLSAAERKAAERDQARLQQARSAIETLKTRSAGAASDERKALAKKRVDQLKQQIRMMQMSGSPNPKALAQLARELKAAVKAYGGDGGSTAGLGAGTPAEAKSSQPATDEGNLAASAVGTDVATKAASNKTPSDEPPTGQADSEASKDGSPGAPVDPYRRLIEATPAQGAEAARRGADKDADREFLSDARELASIIKSLARRAAQEAKADPSRRNDADEAVKASEAVDKAIKDTAGDLGAAGVSISV